MRPNFGDVVSVDNKKLVTIDEDNKNQYTYTGSTVVMGDGVRCATFTGPSGEVYAQPWAIAGMFRRQGQLNAGARLTNEQVREMVRAFVVDKTEIKSLATKYEITESHCENIVTGNSWRHITINYISQLKAGTVAPVLAATNKPKGRNKLNPSIIPFILKDKKINKLPTKELSRKYCVSESQIRKIVAGKYWKLQA